MTRRQIVDHWVSAITWRLKWHLVELRAPGCVCEVCRRKRT